MKLGRQVFLWTSQQHSIRSLTYYKYIGVHMTSNLPWGHHTNIITNNANHMHGYLKHNFSLATVSPRLLLYATLIWTKLEYASSIWDPGLEKPSSSKTVQNCSSSFILSNYYWSASIISMKLHLGLPDLAVCRSILHLSLSHKVYNHNPLLHQSS